MRSVKLLKCKNNIPKQNSQINLLYSESSLLNERWGNKNSEKIVDFEDSAPVTKNKGKRGSISKPKHLQNI